MAQQQLFLFFASVLHQFRLSAPNGPDSVDATPIVGFNQHCPPYEVNIRPRFKREKELQQPQQQQQQAQQQQQQQQQEDEQYKAGRKRVLRRLASNSAKELMAH